MERKNLIGQDQDRVQQELSECARAWRTVINQREPDRVDETSLADEFIANVGILQELDGEEISIEDELG